jgi:hypothetical protein
VCAPANNWFARTASALVRNVVVSRLFLEGHLYGFEARYV